MSINDAAGANRSPVTGQVAALSRDVFAGLITSTISVAYGLSFAALIFVGSIHLGWHYAIDGYAGAAVALFGWWAAGRLVRWDGRMRLFPFSQREKEWPAPQGVGG